MTGRTYLERGRPVTVLVRWSGKGPRNVLIRRSDGRLVVRPFRGLRVTAASRAVSFPTTGVPAST
jgi:acetyl esterase